MNETAARHSGRHILDGAFWGMVANALMLPSGLITMIYLTRALGQASYGDYALALVVVTWIQFTGSALLSRTTIKFTSSADDWRPVASKSLKINVTLGLIAMAMLWLVAAPLAAVLGQSNLAPILRIAAIDIPLLLGSQTHMQVMIGIGRYRHRALSVAVRWLVRPVLIIVLVYMGFSITGALIGCIVASAVQWVLCAYMCPVPLLRAEHFPIRLMWAYAAPLFAASMVLRLMQGMDLALLQGLGSSEEDVGLYAAALNMAMLPTMFTATIAPLLLSTLSRLRHHAHHEQAQRLARQTLRWLMLMALPVSMIAAEARPLVVLLFGQDYEAAGPLLRLLVVASMGYMIVTASSVMMVAADRPRWTLLLTMPILPLAIVGYVWRIPTWGAEGAAMVAMTVGVSGGIVSLLAVCRLWRIAPPGATVVRTIVIGVTVISAAALWPVDGVMTLAKLLIMAAAMAAGLLLLGEFRFAELTVVRTWFVRGANRVDQAGEVS